MELRDKQTGKIITDFEFYRLFPNTSFPAVVDEKTFNSFGYDIVFEGPQAIPETVYQFSMRSGVEQIGDKWFKKYVLGPIFTDSPEATAAQQEEAYKAAKDVERAAQVRAMRTQRLAESDWTQVADAPVDKDAWQTYRQALRDITSQEGFPWNVVWPEKP